MAYNFLRGDRDQPFLLPPDLRDWLPADHLAWFVRDVVDQLDLNLFLRAYRADGHGHPAYDPKTLLGVLLYGYAIGVRSSRQIQRRCIEDLAFRVLAGNQAYDGLRPGYWVAYVGSFEATSRGRRDAERVQGQLPGALVRLIRRAPTAGDTGVPHRSQTRPTTWRVIGGANLTDTVIHRIQTGHRIATRCLRIAGEYPVSGSLEGRSACLKVVEDSDHRPPTHHNGVLVENGALLNLLPYMYKVSKLTNLLCEFVSVHLNQALVVGHQEELLERDPIRAEPLPIA
jgi:hypothetical protein